MSEFLGPIHAKLKKYETDYALDKNYYLNLLWERTNRRVDRVYLFLISAAVAALLIVIIFGLGFVSNLVGFIPVYSSFKSLKAKNKQLDEFWLTYWVVYGSLSVFESLVDRLLFWLPAYYIFKIAFLIWCFHPHYRGSEVIYNRLLKPILVEAETEVDALEKKLKH